MKKTFICYRWVKTGVRRGLPPHRKDLLNTVQKMMQDDQRENPFVNDRPGRKWLEVIIYYTVRNSY